MVWAGEKRLLAPTTLYIVARATADGHRDTQDNLADPKASRRSLMLYRTTAPSFVEFDVVAVVTKMCLHREG